MNKKGKIAIIVASSIAVLGGSGTALYFFVFKKAQTVTEIKLLVNSSFGGPDFLCRQTNIKKGNKYKLVANDLSAALNNSSKTFNDAIFTFTTSNSINTPTYPKKEDSYNINEICDTKYLMYFKTSTGNMLSYRSSDDDPEQNVMNWNSTKFYAKFGLHTFSDTVKSFTWEFTAASTIEGISFKVGLSNY